MPPGTPLGGRRRARHERTYRILQRYALAAPYYSLGGDGLTNCPSERRWFGNNDAGNDGVSIGPCDGGVALFLDASQECA